MKWSIIPIKNRIVEHEHAYLTKKAAKGKMLTKRGTFFYQFTNDAPQQVAYETDIVNKNMLEKQIGNWQLIDTRKADNKGNVLALYCSKQNEARLLVDDAKFATYYDKKSTQWTFINIIGWLFFIVICLFALTANKLPFLPKGPIIPILIVLSFVIAITCTSIFFTYHIGQNDIREKMDVPNISLVRYSIIINKQSQEKVAEVEDTLKVFGRIEKIGDNGTYYLWADINKAELVAELRNITGLDEKQLSIMHPGDLYIMY